MLELIETGFLSILNIETIVIVFIGVALGLVFGAIPGLTA